jgi:hypothetical protein
LFCFAKLYSAQQKQLATRRSNSAFAVVEILVTLQIPIRRVSGSSAHFRNHWNQSIGVFRSCNCGSSDCGVFCGPNDLTHAGSCRKKMRVGPLEPNFAYAKIARAHVVYRCCNTSSSEQESLAQSPPPSIRNGNSMEQDRPKHLEPSELGTKQ